jgi:hypothetical protein
VLKYRVFGSSSHERFYTRPSHAIQDCALQIDFVDIVDCVTRCQTGAPFLAGSAALTEEHLAIFALSAFDLW